MQKLITKVLSETLRNQSDEQVANLFLSLCDVKIYCYNIESHKAYYYNPETTIYENIGSEKLGTIIMSSLGSQLKVILKSLLIENAKEIDDESDIGLHRKQQIKSLGELIKSLGSHNKSTNIAKVVMGKSISTEFVEDFADTARDTINFKNGLVDLKTGLFRNRTHNDFVTKCLAYNHKQERDNENEEEIKVILKQIFNDDDKLLEEQLKFSSYLLTGEQYLKKMLFYYGGGDNAKSFYLKIIGACFPIYYTEIQPETFGAKASQSLVDKQLFNCMRPVRIVCWNFLERFTTRNLNHL